MPVRRSLKTALLALALLAAALALLIGARALSARRAAPAETAAPMETAAPAPDEAEAESASSHEELPRASSVGEALALFSDALRRGETCFVFLAEGDWTTEELNELASALVANSAELAAETRMYHYEFTPEPDGESAYVCIEAEYHVDQELLQGRNLELRSTLDELAAELRSQGGDERALYLAAARAITERADYDEELAAVTEAAALNGEQLCLRSAWGALIAGKTVCTGYAMAFKALCDRLELPCRVVLGSRGGEHAWNEIVLDGETLYMDLNLADLRGDEDSYFLTGAELAAWGYLIR